MRFTSHCVGSRKTLSSGIMLWNEALKIYGISEGFVFFVGIDCLGPMTEEGKFSQLKLFLPNPHIFSNTRAIGFVARRGYEGRKEGRKKFILIQNSTQIKQLT